MALAPQEKGSKKRKRLEEAGGFPDMGALLVEGAARATHAVGIK